MITTLRAYFLGPSWRTSVAGVLGLLTSSPHWHAIVTGAGTRSDWQALLASIAIYLIGRLAADGSPATATPVTLPVTTTSGAPAKLTVTASPFVSAPMTLSAPSAPQQQSTLAAVRQKFM